MRRAAAAVGLLLASPAAADVIGVTYNCDRGVSVPVVYVNDVDTSIAVLYIEGRLINLQTLPTASGARYGWPSDGSSYEWWEHQGAATLSWKDGATGTTSPIYQSCTPQE
tara:strand:- start:32730 stop:33059 length:330 start_codon:yes stop_codon:yes gene_type:complete